MERLEDDCFEQFVCTGIHVRRCQRTKRPARTRVVVVDTELAVVVVKSRQLKRRPNLIGIGRQYVPSVSNLNASLAKTYATLRDAFIWPNMCPPTQIANKKKKSSMVWLSGPLHLPAPDQRCSSVTIDFIEPLPKDCGCNCMTLTDQLGLDIHIIPTACSLTAEKLTTLFFQNWYCENGLPLEIVLDRGKLFLSCFWKALHKLSSI
jgi:hypothetical protein